MICLVCKKRSYSEYCVSHKPRTRIAVTTLPKRSTKPISTRQRIKQRGKYFTKWSLAKEDWFTANAAPKYQCHYCRLWMTQEETTLDHRKSRSRHPELRYDLSNLVPCCFTCNGLKGSVDHDNFNHDCPDGKKEGTDLRAADLNQDKGMNTSPGAATLTGKADHE